MRHSLDRAIPVCFKQIVPVFRQSPEPTTFTILPRSPFTHDLARSTQRPQIGRAVEPRRGALARGGGTGGPGPARRAPPRDVAFGTEHELGLFPTGPATRVASPSPGI